MENRDLVFGYLWLNLVDDLVFQTAKILPGPLMIVLRRSKLLSHGSIHIADDGGFQLEEDELTAPPPIVAPAPKAPSEKKKEEPSIEEDDYNVDDFVLDEDNISLDYGDIKWTP